MSFSRLTSKLRGSNPGTATGGHAHTGGCCGGHDHDHTHGKEAHAQTGEHAPAHGGCGGHGHDQPEQPTGGAA